MIQHSVDLADNDHVGVRTTRRMRLIHACNNVLLRELLSERFTHTNGINFVASTDLNAAIPAVISQMRPDVTLLTLKLGTASNHELPFVRAALNAAKTGKVAIMAPAFLPGQVSDLSREGVNGFLLESTDWQMLVRSLIAVHRGSFVAAPETARAALGSHDTRDSALSPAEIRLMELVASGLSNHEIALRLNIADSTVRSRLGSVLTKLESTNRTRAVTESIRRGYIAVDQATERPVN